MAGLNHEATEEVAGDLAIDLEVTSNRPDCLGHIGIAREVAVLWGQTLTLPAANPGESKTPVESLVSVRIDCPELCLRYTARVVRGVKIGPSPPLDGPAAGSGGPDADQQRGRHQQLRVDGVRPAAAHVRFRQAQGGREKGTVPICAKHPNGPFRQTGTVPLFPRRKLSSAARCPARRSRPSTTRPMCWAPRCA